MKGFDDVTMEGLDDVTMEGLDDVTLMGLDDITTCPIYTQSGISLQKDPTHSLCNFPHHVSVD